MTNVHTPMAFGFKQFAFKRWEADLRLNCFLSSPRSTDAVKSFYRLWHLLTQSIRGWKQTQTWSDLCLVPVCAAHTDRTPVCSGLGCAQTCSVCWCCTSMWLCWTNNSLCQNAPRLVLPWIPTWPWEVWHKSFNPRLVQMRAWNAVIGKPRSFSWKGWVLFLQWHMPGMGDDGLHHSTANAIAVWVRIKDHAWANVRLVISWSGIHQTTAGT